MNRTRVAGAALTVAGVAGYLAGLAAPYPGRAFTVTAVIVGVTLASIGDGSRRGGDEDDDSARRDDHADGREEVSAP